LKALIEHHFFSSFGFYFFDNNIKHFYSFQVDSDDFFFDSEEIKIPFLSDSDNEQLVEYTYNEEYDSENEEESDDEEQFSLYATVVIFFYRRKAKTTVYFTNPFIAPDLTSLI